MGQVPGRKRVGAVALMHQRQGRNEPRVGQIVIEPLDLVGQHQPLVDDHPRRQAGHVAVSFCSQLAGARRRASSRLRMTYSFHSSMSGGVSAPRAMKTCRMTGSTSRASQPSTRLSTGTSRQPNSRCPSSAMICFQPLLAQLPLRRRRAARRRCPTPYSPGGGSSKPSSRHLAAARIRAASASECRQPSPVSGSQPQAPRWRQVDQNLQPRADDLVALVAVDVDDEADAAGIVLLGGIVQAELRVGRMSFQACVVFTRGFASRTILARERPR